MTAPAPVVVVFCRAVTRVAASLYDYPATAPLTPEQTEAVAAVIMAELDDDQLAELSDIAAGLSHDQVLALVDATTDDGAP